MYFLNLSFWSVEICIAVLNSYLIASEKRGPVQKLDHDTGSS